LTHGQYLAAIAELQSAIWFGYDNGQLVLVQHLKHSRHPTQGEVTAVGADMSNIHQPMLQLSVNCQLLAHSR
jgi:hypothetical protein